MINLLIIDDDEDIRFILKMVLGKTGKYHLLEASSAAEGLEILRSQNIDFILLDHILPDGLGADIVNEWAAGQLIDAANVIMLTAKQDPVMEAALAELGVARVIHKPFDAMKLVRDLEEIIGS